MLSALAYEYMLFELSTVIHSSSPVTGLTVVGSGAFVVSITEGVVSVRVTFLKFNVVPAATFPKSNINCTVSLVGLNVPE